MSRPLSNNTTTTGETVTPKNMHSLTSRAGRLHHNVQAIPAHLINDSGIGVDEQLITYDPRMPPPPVPSPPTTSQPTPTKEKRRSKPLFGLSAAPWSRPTTPKNEQVPLPSPPQSPRNRPSKVSRIENWFKHGPSFSLKLDPVAELTCFVTRRHNIGDSFVITSPYRCSTAVPTYSLFFRSRRSRRCDSPSALNPTTHTPTWRGIFRF